MGKSDWKFMAIGLLIVLVLVMGIYGEENRTLTGKLVELRKQNQELELEADFYRELLQDAYKNSDISFLEPQTVEVEATAYCPCPLCCGEWSDGYTFTGTKATEGRTIAVDPDVIPLGTEVYIDGSLYVAEDVGGAIKGNRIDIFFDNHDDALAFGRQNITMEVLQ